MLVKDYHKILMISLFFNNKDHVIRIMSEETFSEVKEKD